MNTRPSNVPIPVKLIQTGVIPVARPSGLSANYSPSSVTRALRHTSEEFWCWLCWLRWSSNDLSHGEARSSPVRRTPFRASATRERVLNAEPIEPAEVVDTRDGVESADSCDGCAQDPQRFLRLRRRDRRSARSRWSGARNPDRVPDPGIGRYPRPLRPGARDNASGSWPQSWCANALLELGWHDRPPSSQCRAEISPPHRNGSMTPERAATESKIVTSGCRLTLTSPVYRSSLTTSRQLSNRSRRSFTPTQSASICPNSRSGP